MSYEHLVRIGLLLTDGTMYVSLLDQLNFRWMSKGLVVASFDLQRAEDIVYSRTADALFWPQRRSSNDNADDDNEDGKINCWDVEMCSVDRRVQRTAIRGLPELQLQPLRDELVLLTRRHGVLFVDYRQLRDSRNFRFGRYAAAAGWPTAMVSGGGRHAAAPATSPSGKSPAAAVGTNTPDSGIYDVQDHQRRICRFDDSVSSAPDDSVDEELPLAGGLLATPELSDANNNSLLQQQQDLDKPTLEARYWSPESRDLPLVSLHNFTPRQTRTELRAFCHCKDASTKRGVPPKDGSLKTVVLYGNTIYKLTATSCTPLSTIELPMSAPEVDRPMTNNNFKLMYLGRVVVIYDDQCIAGYLGSTQPVKIKRGDFLHAGYGIVCNASGIFRIKMSEPRFSDFEVHG